MPRQRTEADERARAAAREAERLNWERTRGAGSDVMKLKEEGGEREGEWQESDVLPTLEQCESYRSEVSRCEQPSLWPMLTLLQPVEVPSADVLLSCGVSDYTVLPRILGRGKFSTVFMASKNGELSAIKHTALFPHHQLISTRLLREPTLLAELPPHPNLVAVQETVRTPGHFYLVEEYLGGYVTLEALVGQLSQAPADAPATLPFDVASCVLDQLISAVQAIHVPLQICHRDIKPENILVHPDSLQLKLLDFGLATHYSKSEPKLSTCCGSPAFHCPEIVRALASPPGAVSYWGPEVDAWTVGVTMLRCLTGARFPLGSSHSSLRSMAIRAQRAVATIADPALRERVGALLDMDGTRRMRRFSEMAAANETQHGEANRGNKAFKSTTFIPVEPTHTMKLPVLVGPAAERAVVSPGAMTPGQSRHATPQGSRAGSPIATPRPEPYTEPSSPGAPAPIVLLNPTMQPPQRLLSFMKYCFRCAGILYHAWPDPPVGGGDGYWQRALSESVGELPLASPTTPLFPVFGTAERPDGYAHVHIFECVIELPEEQPPEESGFSLVQSIMAAFGRRPTNKRSLSTPAKPRVTERDAAKAPGTPTAARATPGASGKEGEIRCLRFYVIARFPKLPSGGMGAVSRPPFSRQASQATFGRRSRASSAAGSAAAAGGLPSAPASGNSSGTESPTARKVSLDVDDAGHPRDGTPRGTRDATPKGVRDGSRARSGILRSVSSPHLLPADAELSIETQVALPPATGRSPSSSRAASRTRKASRASRSRKSKVFIQVTDERAVEFVRKALSVGGTSETSDADEPDELASLLREAGEPGNPQRSDQTRRRPGAANRSRSRASIATLTSQDPATPTASRPGTVRSPSLAGFPFPTRDDEQESRGRRGRDAANGPRGGRAPSMLSSTTLHEEAVTPRDDLRQTLDVLAASLRPLTRSSDMPLRQGSASSGSSAAASPGEAHSSEPSPALSAGGVSSASPSPAPSPGDTPSSEASSNAGRSSDGAYQQVRTLLAGLSQRLAAAEQSGASALEDMISPVVFALFSSLSPALGLEDREVADLPRVSSAVAEDTTLSGLASSALQVVARHASPRELYIAAQERLEMLADQSRRDGGAVARGGIWCAALEVAGIVSFLAAGEYHGE
jgi:serine/threonine protein kinase